MTSTSTYSIKETAALTKQFVLGNFKAPFLTILPYVFVLSLLAVIVNHGAATLFLALVSGYFGAVFAANLHRAYIGNTTVEPFNPLAPVKNDYAFIGALLLIYAITIALFAAAGFIFALIGGKTAAAVGFLLMIPVAIFLGARISLILPDRAVGGKMKLKESYYMSRGLVWKIIITPIVASWKWLLACFFWVFMCEIVITMAMPDKNSLARKVTAFIAESPANIGLGYFIAALGVATLSNYYIWARQNQIRD